MEDGLYLINQKRKLYYQDGKYWKPLFYIGRFSGTISPLQKQPKNIKTIIKISQ